MKTKSSIRKLRGYPVSRKLHHLIAELHSTQKRLEHLAIEVEAVEAEARAMRFKAAVTPAVSDEIPFLSSEDAQ